MKVIDIFHLFTFHHSIFGYAEGNVPDQKLHCHRGNCSHLLDTSSDQGGLICIGGSSCSLRSRQSLACCRSRRLPRSSNRSASSIRSPPAAPASRSRA